MYPPIRSGRGNQQVRTLRPIAAKLDEFQREFMESGKLPPETRRNDRLIQTMRMPSGNTDFMEVQYAYAARKFGNRNRQVANWLLISPGSVYLAFTKLGIEWCTKKPPFTEKQLRRAIQKEGMNTAAAAVHFKCSSNTVAIYKHKWDIYHKGLLNRREMFMLIEKWGYKEGITHTELRKRLMKRFSIKAPCLCYHITKMKRAGILDDDII